MLSTVRQNNTFAVADSLNTPLEKSFGKVRRKSPTIGFFTLNHDGDVTGPPRRNES